MVRLPTASMIILFCKMLLLVPAAHAQFNFDWLGWTGIDTDHGGKLPFLPTDRLSVVDCPASTMATSRCNIGNIDGVFVCRRVPAIVGEVPLSVCTPNINATGNATVLGIDGDTCGCCGEECPDVCPCGCNDGRGVMMETNLTQWFPIEDA